MSQICVSIRFNSNVFVFLRKKLIESSAQVPNVCFDIRVVGAQTSECQQLDKEATNETSTAVRYGGSDGPGPGPLPRIRTHTHTAE